MEDRDECLTFACLVFAILPLQRKHPNEIKESQSEVQCFSRQTYKKHSKNLNIFIQPPTDGPYPRTLNQAYLPSLVPDQCGSGVVDGGELWFRILGEEEGLLAPSQRLTAQGALRGSGWRETHTHTHTHTHTSRYADHFPDVKPVSNKGTRAIPRLIRHDHCQAYPMGVRPVINKPLMCHKGSKVW